MKHALETLRGAFPEAVVAPVDDWVKVTLPAETSDADLDRVEFAIQDMNLLVRVGVSRAGRIGT